MFIAVWPPAPVAELLTALPREEAPRLRWTTADQWHITLRFLGDVPETDALSAFESIRARPVDALLGPTVERLAPEVIVAPVRGLEPLAAEVLARTADLGEAPHPDGFRGHLTLARQRGGGSCSVDGRAISGTFRVEEIVLVRSDLHDAGARYTSVARRPLSL